MPARKSFCFAARRIRKIVRPRSERRTDTGRALFLRFAREDGIRGACGLPGKLGRRFPLQSFSIRRHPGCAQIMA